LSSKGVLEAAATEIPQQILEFAVEDEIGGRPQKIGLLVEQIKVMYRLSHTRLGLLQFHRLDALAPSGPRTIFSRRASAPLSFFSQWAFSAVPRS